MRVASKRALTIATVIALMPLTPLAAQRPTAQKPSNQSDAWTVNGALFVRTVGGIVIRGAGNNVALLDGSPLKLFERTSHCVVVSRMREGLRQRDLAALDTLTSINARIEGVNRINAADSVAAEVRRGTLLMGSAFRLVEADASGNFRIEDVPPGEYVLTSQLDWAGNRATWWLPVSLPDTVGDRTYQVQLSHTNDRKFSRESCGP